MKALKAIFRFRGGIHPHYHKELSRTEPIRPIPIPKTLYVSMAQHLGAPSKPTVKKGDAVLRGQVIADSSGFVSASVHAPTSGKIASIEDMPGAGGAHAATIVIEADGEDKAAEAMPPISNWKNTDAKTLISRVAEAGIVGMGGAGFPTHVKLSPPPGKAIDTLIINGAECEPFLTADHRLMLEHAERVWVGAQIIRHILGARDLHIAIEDNKPDAVAAMEKVMADADANARIVVLDTEYPQGAEKQQIYSVTGRQVPCGGLPMDVGTVVENVGTTAAVWDAIVNGRPLIERVTTVTGPIVQRPSNILGRLGIRCDELVAFCGGLKSAPGKVIFGGPMMGLAQANLLAATTKTTSGILILPPEMVRQYSSMPCISCARCVGACPMNLLPCDLSQMLEAEDYEAAEKYNVLDCVECGCCAYECPAQRPLVQHMRQGKARIMKKRREAKEKEAQAAKKPA